MNIVIFSDYDIAGNLTLLSKMINKYTIHSARCIIAVHTYFNYDEDIILMKGTPEDPEALIPDENAINEAEELIKNADFFHIGRQPLNFGNIKFENILNQRNCIFQYFGTYLRNNDTTLKRFHEQSGIKAISWVDATMLKNSGAMYYHLPDMFDITNVKPWWEIKTNNDIPLHEQINIAHSPTNREFKKTEFFLSIIKKLKKEYSINLILLEGLSHNECIKRKQQAHIMFDQISVGRFALAAIESMAMGQAVLCSVSNLVMSSFPDNPIIPVTEKTLEQELRHIIENRSIIKNIGENGIKWVTKNCNPAKIIQQYIYLYDYIINGNRLIESSENQFKDVIM